MCADGDESGMRSGGGRDLLCRLILGELCADEENVALDRRVPCSELVSRILCACAPSPVVVSNSSSKPLSTTPSSHVQASEHCSLRATYFPLLRISCMNFNFEMFFSGNASHRGFNHRSLAEAAAVVVARSVTTG